MHDDMKLSETIVGEQMGLGDGEVASAANAIRQLRITIDKVDAAIIRLLAQRFAATDQVGGLKAQAGFAPADPAREQEQREQLRTLSLEAGLDPAIAEQYHAFVASLAKERHAQAAQRANSEG
ncbi:chorismate mutase [Bombiscardovia apis]|uniref:Chorismate mutase n=1 Tax=Bombiscardovia apis TaxID=2932182 RepID=A0ABM8BB06_9BIFI|nr:chorismate mutase [Bombiscardovia apis]BDR54029.1 chorismate mutase [Bombiscardovia apis]